MKNAVRVQMTSDDGTLLEDFFVIGEAGDDDVLLSRAIRQNLEKRFDVVEEDNS